MSRILFNGKFRESNEPLFDASSRAFRFGDGFFESMRMVNGTIQHWSDHIVRIEKGLSLLKLNTPNGFDFVTFPRLCGELSALNEMPFARIRLQIIRDTGGMYAPEGNSSSYLVECDRLEQATYALNEKGLSLGIFSDLPKLNSVFSTIKSCNALASVMGSIFCAEHKLDDALMVNPSGNIIESTNSNVFFVVRDELFTPPLSEGCVDGIMRKKIIELAGAIGTKVIEKPIPLSTAESAEEIFLTNAVRGIRWVEHFQNKKLKRQVATNLMEKLAKSTSI